MPRRADITVQVNSSSAFQQNGAGTQYLVKATNGYYYAFFTDQLNDVAYRKSVDLISWELAVTVIVGVVSNLSIWYDRWSGVAGDLIHVAASDGTTDDTLYRTVNTASSDALSTQTVIFAGLSTALGGHLSITRAVGGNVYCKTVIDAGAEGGFFRLPNANVPNGAWDAARTVDEAIATNDQIILLPNLTAADTQDIMAIFWDGSASEVSRKLYDDSANTWGETSIATGMTALPPSSQNLWANFSAAVDVANNRIVLVAWSASDAANADLRCWTVTDSAITEVTNVVLNSTDDQGLCALNIDTSTGYWTVFYGGISTGADNWATQTRIYYKISKDAGSTWGTETLATVVTNVLNLRQLIPLPYSSGSKGVIGYVAFEPTTGFLVLWANADITQPRAQSVIGV